MNENKSKSAEKKEIKTGKEHTIPLKKYSPVADIIETKNDLLIYMEMAGVNKDQVKIKLEKNIVEITGEVDSGAYAYFKPLYTEYNIGDFSRRFELSNEIDKSKIEAKMEDGVLELILPKVVEEPSRLIQVN